MSQRSLATVCEVYQTHEEHTMQTIPTTDAANNPMTSERLDAVAAKVSLDARIRISFGMIFSAIALIAFGVGSALDLPGTLAGTLAIAAFAVACLVGGSDGFTNRTRIERLLQSARDVGGYRIWTYGDADWQRMRSHEVQTKYTDLPYWLLAGAAAVLFGLWIKSPTLTGGAAIATVGVLLGLFLARCVTLNLRVKQYSFPGDVIFTPTAICCNGAILNWDASEELSITFDDRSELLTISVGHGKYMRMMSIPMPRYRVKEFRSEVEAWLDSLEGGFVMES